jgi:xylan 1,4-beta-xylosidase
MKSFALIIAGLALTALASATKVTDTVTVDLSAPTTPFPHYWKRSFGSGHAALTLRDDWRSHLKKATQELGLQGVRHHGLLDDDMEVGVL